MTQRAKPKRTVEQWQWNTIGCLIRLAKRYGQYPSASEVAQEMHCSARWIEGILRGMRDEGLVALIGRANASGWMPTQEAARWRGLELPHLETSAVPPRSVRSAGVGAIRAWNKKRSLATRVAAVRVFERPMEFDRDSLIPEQPFET